MTKQQQAEMAELGLNEEQLAERRRMIAERIPKPKPAAAEPGTLTEQQRIRLRILLEDVVEAERNYWIAEEKRSKAGVAYNAYLESLTKTGQQ